MKTKLLIFPYNGNGLEAVGCLNLNFDFIGFIDDEEKKMGKQKNGFTVFSREVINKYRDALILAVPGRPETYLKRKTIIDSLKIEKNRFAKVIHPESTVSNLAKIGRNVLIMAGSIITSNAVIGNNVCILPNTVIHHDTRIGDYTLIGSNVSISGYTRIGKNCYIGSGSNIINNIKIGNTTLVGMGSNVTSNISARKIVFGNPAKVIKSINE